MHPGIYSLATLLVKDSALKDVARSFMTFLIVQDHKQHISRQTF